MAEAVFPRTLECGGVAVEPLTLRRAVALDAFGIDAADSEGADVGKGNALRALWILGLDACSLASAVANPQAAARDFAAWTEAEGSNVLSEDAADAVRSVLRLAWRGYVPAKSGKTMSFGPTGYGWPLVFAEAFAAEYGTTLDEALDVPMCRLFAMIACARRRNGGEDGGPDYYDRMAMPRTAGSEQR